MRRRDLHDAGHDRRLLAPPDEAAGNPSDLAHTLPTTVQIAILTDGLADVYSIGGHVINYASLTDLHFVPIGGYVPTRMFLGNLVLVTTARARPR